jgi:kinesin family protein 6/9
MDNKEKVKVVIRTRPTSHFASKNIQIDTEAGSITITKPKKAESGPINNQLETWKFQYEKILHNASQEDVFDNCARGVISSIVEGYNGTIMCYGQTGAGKTFTMNGSTANFKYRGVVPRTLSVLFQEIDSRFDQQVTVRCSYIEIYNELMFDLLSPIPTHEQSGNISIVEDATGNVKVKGLSMHPCTTEEEALNMLFEGETNRTICQHELNKQSSRSHCIFTVHIESKSRVESTEKVHVSKLHLVDLAGSERTKKTNSTGITLKEAAFINKSLSFLEQVVVAVSDKHRDHIPYRQSKLTNLLKDSIGGNCKTLMIANIWPEPDHLEETISTCKFASRMMRVANQATININQDPTILIKKYEREIRDLKQELAMHDTLANRGSINYDTEASERDQYQLAKQFLTGEIDDIDELNSIRQCRNLMHQMRLIYRKLEQNARIGSSKHGGDADNGLGGEGGDVDPAELQRRQTLAEEDGVGDEDEGNGTGGFGIGKALRDSKPQHKIQPTKDGEDYNQDDGEESKADGENDSALGTEGRPSKRVKKKQIKPKQEAFNEYKGDEGKTIEDGIKTNRADLRAKKNEMAKLKEVCNKAKKEIDSLKSQLESKNDDKQKSLELDEDEDVIDEEEYSMLKQLKEHKKIYRENFDQYKSLKGDAFFIQNSVDQLKESLIFKFEVWYDENFEAPAGESNAEKPLSSGVSDV